MKRAAGIVFAAILAASEGFATSYYALEIHGGSRIYATDKPVRKGRTVLFHRYPDGVYMSLAASEVAEVVSVAEPPAPDGLAPGQSKYIGQATFGPYAEIPSAPLAPPPAMTMDYSGDYGYYGSYWGGGGYVPPRPPGPGALAPPRIGPNGFPILAPPGTAGSRPPNIGPNGFPIISPPPPVAVPRQRPM
jgi:hypothetical protein